MSKQITMEIEGQIDSRTLGMVPGGTRVDLTYVDSGSKLVIHAHDGDGGKVPDLNGTILAGHDWALVRDDAVIVFDGKVTFEVTFPSDAVRGWPAVKVPILAEIEGRVDLREVRDGKARPYQGREATEILRAWQRGDFKGRTLPVGVFLQFTVDRGTDQGKLLANLERTTFFGMGEYTFQEPRDRIKLACMRAIDVPRVLAAKPGAKLVAKAIGKSPAPPGGEPIPSVPGNLSEVPGTPSEEGNGAQSGTPA
jgi:hypothetical protein